MVNPIGRKKGTSIAAKKLALPAIRKWLDGVPPTQKEHNEWTVMLYRWTKEFQMHELAMEISQVPIFYTEGNHEEENAETQS